MSKTTLRISYTCTSLAGVSNIHSNSSSCYLPNKVSQTEGIGIGYRCLYNKIDLQNFCINFLQLCRIIFHTYPEGAKPPKRRRRLGWD
jgi:hypothetical protein